MERREESKDRAIVASYREFVPRKELRDHIQAFFSFVPGAGTGVNGRAIVREILFKPRDSFCSPLFADANASIVFELGMTCRAEGVWQRSGNAPNGKVIGPMRSVGLTDLGQRAAMIGAYVMPGRVASIVHAPASELTDRVLPVEDLWGGPGLQLPAELAELDEAARISHLESALLRRLADRRGSRAEPNVTGLLAWLLERRGRVSVERLAQAAGVSRQHLARVFGELVGVPPKLYCRLARFHAGLAYADRGDDVEWAQAALTLGYADQSHMIAEFKEFSSLTPQQLAAGRWFHPFIERARRSQPTRW